MVLHINSQKKVKNLEIHHAIILAEDTQFILTMINMMVTILTVFGQEKENICMQTVINTKVTSKVIKNMELESLPTNKKENIMVLW